LKGLKDGTAYKFLVYAYNKNGWGAPSDPSGSATPTSTAKPDAPTIGTAKATGTSGEVKVSWTAPTDNGGAAIDNYSVEPWTDGKAILAHTQFTKNTDTSLTLTGLTDGTAYTFKVYAHNSIGWGTASEFSNSAKPSKTTITTTGKPGAPTITSATATGTSGEIKVTWTAPADNGGYPIVLYSVEPWIGTTKQTPQLTKTAITSLTLKELTNGTAYKFLVYAYNKNGWGAPSKASSSVTPTSSSEPEITALGACGNGTLDNNEDCDGAQLGGETCDSVVGPGYTGALSCDSSCQFVTTACVAPTTTPSGCSDSTECQDGQTCSNGTCTAAPATSTVSCSTDSDCSGGQVCQNSACVAPTTSVSCSTDSDCSDGQTCQNGACVNASTTYTPDSSESGQTTAQPESNTTPTSAPTPPPPPTPSKCPGVNYPSDISDNWANNYIMEAYDLCIYNNYSSGRFDPDVAITRFDALKAAMITVNMVPDYNCTKKSCRPPFVDLTNTQRPWVTAAWEQKIIKGIGKHFYGTQYLTRDDGAALLLKVFKIAPYQNCYTNNCGAGYPHNFFTDIFESWVGPYIRVLWDMKVIQPSGENQFHPKNNLTRAEWTSFLMQIKQLMHK
jgi:hypothetical protein